MFFSNAEFLSSNLPKDTHFINQTINFDTLRDERAEIRKLYLNLELYDLELLKKLIVRLPNLEYLHIKARNEGVITLTNSVNNLKYKLGYVKNLILENDIVFDTRQLGDPSTTSHIRYFLELMSSLESVYLKNINIINNESSIFYLKQPIHRIEFLKVENCRIKITELSSPSLKNIDIINCDNITFLNILINYQMREVCLNHLPNLNTVNMGTLSRSHVLGKLEFKNFANQKIGLKIPISNIDALHIVDTDDFTLNIQGTSIIKKLHIKSSSMLNIEGSEFNNISINTFTISHGDTRTKFLDLINKCNIALILANIHGFILTDTEYKVLKCEKLLIDKSCVDATIIAGCQSDNESYKKIRFNRE